MNVTLAKQKLVRAGALLGLSDRPLKQQSATSGAIGEISSLAAMLDAADPVQAKMLNELFSALDHLKLAEKHCADAAINVEEAWVQLGQNEKALAKQI